MHAFEQAQAFLNACIKWRQAGAERAVLAESTFVHLFLRHKKVGVKHGTRCQVHTKNH